MECPICIEPLSKENTHFQCFQCKYLSCIDCMKKYLIDLSSEPHCINCRNVIPYDQYIKNFDKKWRLGIYKKQKENILWDKEQTLMQITVQKIAKKNEIVELNKKRQLLMNEICKIDTEILNNEKFIHTSDPHKLIDKFKYNYRCISDKCPGFLNESFICDLCNINVCDKCFCEKGSDHICDNDIVENVKMIKKDSKPCPKCGEYINKIDGCDQMFCTLCGTAFSWKTGNIELGVIHNPHAHTFFQNNPDILNNYLNGVNEHQCRQAIPNYQDIYSLGQNLDINLWKRLESIYRHASEFRFYKNQYFINYINSNDDENEDIRYRFLYKMIDEKSFKSLIHSRYKKRSFKKSVYEILISTFDIMNNFLWSLRDIYFDKNKNINTKNSEISEIFKFIDELQDDTNEVIYKIYEEHNYKICKVLSSTFLVMHIN